MENDDLVMVATVLIPENVPVLINTRMITSISALFDGAPDGGGMRQVIGASTITVMGLPRPMGVKGSPENIKARLRNANVRIIDMAEVDTDDGGKFQVYERGQNGQ